MQKSDKKYWGFQFRPFADVINIKTIGMIFSSSACLIGIITHFSVLSYFSFPSHTVYVHIEFFFLVYAE